MKRRAASARKSIPRPISSSAQHSMSNSEIACACRSSRPEWAPTTSSRLNAVRIQDLLPTALTARTWRPWVLSPARPQQPQRSVKIPRGRLHQAIYSVDFRKHSSHRRKALRKTASRPARTNLARNSRDSWIAPGNVMIEDGLENFPPLTGSALLRTPPLPSTGAPNSNGHSFEPQAPAEFQRSSRRLPMIEEFPPQAQKEWNAHQGASTADMQNSKENRAFLDVWRTSAAV